ncbi:MAG: hypothetical protein OEV66_00160 [Spirochaetia bacterium]|nr:hypothetical protein [Spirochaetia bacterium]
MWGNSRVIRHRFFHPFLWPWYVFASLIAVYCLFVFIVYYLYQKEKFDPSKILYEKALDIRRQELMNLKLNGAEPFVWKPLFKCKSLQQKKIKKEFGDVCIQTTMEFVEKVKKSEINTYRYLPDDKVEYIENASQPCLICHQKKNQEAVLWTFTYKVQKPDMAFTKIWLSPDFLYFHAFFWGVMLLYMFMRGIMRLMRANDLIAVAIKSGRQDVIENLFSGRWKAERRMFLYIEISGGMVSGYIPRRYLLRLYKKYFTGELNFSELDLRIGVVEYKTMSFEGLRIASAIASKAVSSSAIVQDKIIGSTISADMKKAVWKRKDSETHFNVINL